METAELWRITNATLQSIKDKTDFILDADTAELDIVHPGDLIDNKKCKIDACKAVRMKLTKVYSLIEKIEEQEKVDIVNLEVLIDESIL